MCRLFYPAFVATRAASKSSDRRGRRENSMSKLILFLVIFLTAISSFAQKETWFPTNKDKSAIIRSILSDSDLLNRGLSVGETPDKVNLSLENISTYLLPKIKGINFVLFNRRQIKGRIKTGFLYYKFGRFKVVGKKIRVSFGHYFENQRGGASYSGGLVYEFNKVRGKWMGNEVSGWGSIS